MRLASIGRVESTTWIPNALRYSISSALSFTSSSRYVTNCIAIFSLGNTCISASLSMGCTESQITSASLMASLKLTCSATALPCCVVLGRCRRLQQFITTYIRQVLTEHLLTSTYRKLTSAKANSQMERVRSTLKILIVNN